MDQSGSPTPQRRGGERPGDQLDQRNLQLPIPQLHPQKQARSDVSSHRESV